MFHRGPFVLLSSLPLLLLGGLSGCGSPSAGLVGARVEDSVAAPSAPEDRTETAPQPAAPPVPTALVRLQAEKPAAPRPAAEQKAPAGQPFTLPADDAGKLLSEVLPPASRRAPLNNPLRSVPGRAPAPKIAEPPATLPPAPMALVRLPVAPRKDTFRPEFLGEEGLGDLLGPPSMPKLPSFAAGRLTRVESEDVIIPPALPAMATPVPDRVPLDDATGTASTAAVLSAPLPSRTAVTPYLKMSVPDPFEHRTPLTVKVPPEESEPQSGTPLPK